MKATIPEVVDLLWADNSVSIFAKTTSGELFLGKFEAKSNGSIPDYFTVNSMHPEANHLLNKEYKISEENVGKIMNELMVSMLSFSVDV